jgi:hypothetical protein
MFTKKILLMGSDTQGSWQLKLPRNYIHIRDAGSIGSHIYQPTQNIDNNLKICSILGLPEKGRAKKSSLFLVCIRFLYL